VGDPAEITDPANSTVRIAACVTRLSGEFDPETRTMLTEIDFDNRRGLIPPGSFVRVTLKLRNHARGLEIPAEALVLRGTRTFVALVRSDNRVTYRPVTVTNDDGVHVSVSSGLRVGDRIALNIGDNVPENGKIQPVTVSLR
jgi:multidrug efflux pump subunit AcrA (membrane-fusion protein)